MQLLRRRRSIRLRRQGYKTVAAAQQRRPTLQMCHVNKKRKPAAYGLAFKSIAAFYAY